MTASQTTDSYRNSIDAGETGDKVAFPDPAAAPLGTDDEAAGQKPQIPPAPPASRQASQQRETRLPTPLVYGAIAAVLGAALIIVAGLALA